jgi:hypothetical protein
MGWDTFIHGLYCVAFGVAGTFSYLLGKDVYRIIKHKRIKKNGKNQSSKRAA